MSPIGNIYVVANEIEVVNMNVDNNPESDDGSILIICLRDPPYCRFISIEFGFPLILESMTRNSRYPNKLDTVMIRVFRVIVFGKQSSILL